MSLERVVAQMPAAVVVLDALSRTIVHINARAQEMTQRQLGRAIPPELTPDWEIFHLDVRPYTMDEWPLVRSITTGEEVVEEEYFKALGDGLVQIAARLRITTRTERNHVASIFSKLGVHSRLQAVLFAVRYGVIRLR